MARQPKPWYRKDRDSWFVTIGGVRHNLGNNKKVAMERYYALMRTPNAAKVASKSFAAIADAFLDWVKPNRSADTFEWYRYRIERFCQRYPDLSADEIKPFHVQEWVDSYTHLSQTSRRNYVRSVKRCLKWALRQGYVDTDPIADMEVPGAEAREVRVLKEEFETLCSFIRDDTFLELCRVCYTTGCRPQEILRVEARHYEPAHKRWVLPPSEAKGKKRPRIVYLPPYALAVTVRLCSKFPKGRLFRNTRDKPWTTDAVNNGFTRLQVRMGKDALKKGGHDLKVLTMAAFGLDAKAYKALGWREQTKLTNKVASSYAPHYSLYSFRHSWATNALETGLDALTVATLMGHSDPSTLARVYSHISSNPEHMSSQALRALGE